MSSLKIPSSKLQAIRETDRMLSEVERRTGKNLSPLLHVSVSTGVINFAHDSIRRHLNTVGSVAAGWRLLGTKSVIELVKKYDFWLPVKGNLLLDNEHFTFSYQGDVMFMMRTLEDFPNEQVM